MKKNLIIIFITCYSIASAQYKFDFSHLSISESKVDTINFYYNKVIESKGLEKKKNEKLFFLSLPNNYSEMSDAMYINSSKKIIEYEKNKNNKDYIPKNSIINPWVTYLSTMDYYDKKEYYKKYFNICIGGRYGGDYLRSGFEIYKRFLIDTEVACREMKKLNDKEIESIFYFIFDESYPKHNKKNVSLYNKILLKIKKYDIKLSKLLENGYKKVIKNRN
ncbi:hypothetical protein [Aquimarina longa]|uniref:hypothetical protein n=1 Tax=Aquimarina longa TaxID=1080221 RepID=UPI0007817F70|nr:hypothetical protein [Aquimarina longa]